MDTKTKGIVSTIAAVVLCGCPGLFLCFFGAMSTFVSAIPGADIDVGGSSDPAAATAMGIGALCLSLIFIAKKPEAVITNEPLPPAS